MNTHLGSKIMFLTISSGNMCRVNQCQDKSSAACLPGICTLWYDNTKHIVGSKPKHNFFLTLKVASLHFFPCIFDLSSLVRSISIPVYNTRTVTKSWNYIYRDWPPIKTFNAQCTFNQFSSSLLKIFPCTAHDRPADAVPGKWYISTLQVH